MFYDSYERLEVHFTRSHFICPYEQCKQKCYVAFQTENELQAHLNIVHTKKSVEAKVNANALLGFRVHDEEEKASSTYEKRGKNDKNNKEDKKQKKLQDTEGVDFAYYFSQKYMNEHTKFTDRGRGRGRGGRG